MAGRKQAPLALERVGFLTGYKVKPKKLNAKGEEALPSTVVLTIEAVNEEQLLKLLAKIQRDGCAVSFGIEPNQKEIPFGEGATT